MSPTEVPGPDGRAVLTEAHRRHIFEGEPDEDLIQGLEPDQLLEVMNMRLPPARISAGVSIFLWALRVALVVLAGMAVFSFVVGLRSA
ncbi:MAG: hypothetical protein NVSMB17_04530 [Candidatus Dormibacteria bacterium]